MRNGWLEQGQYHSSCQGLDMTKEDYLEKRVDAQITWYDNKSGQNQLWFKVLRIVEIVSAALIPFLSLISSKHESLPYVIAVFGMVIAVSAAMTSLFKFQENWIQYRASAEQLKHEKFLFQAGAGEYERPDSFASFVERVESLISRENSLWAQQAKKQEKTELEN